MPYKDKAKNAAAKKESAAKDNVRVISWRANNLKRDGSLAEFEAIAAYMRGER